MSTIFLAFLSFFKPTCQVLLQFMTRDPFFFPFVLTLCFQYDLQKLLVIMLIQQLDNGCQELRDTVACLAQKHIEYLGPRALWFLGNFY